MHYNYPIDQYNGVLIPMTTMYNVISDSSLYQVLKMYKYVLKHFPACKQFLNKFTYNFVSDTLQVLIFVCSAVSELHFYGCRHPCSFNSYFETFLVGYTMTRIRVKSNIISFFKKILT